MTKITITGYSDDNVEIEGGIREEWAWYPEDDEERWITVSDGTILSVRYDKDGIWRFAPVIKGSAAFSKIDGSVDEDTNDVITLEGDDIRWVSFATKYVLKLKQEAS